MKKAKVIFYKCIQDSQDFGSDDEHMVSRVFFNYEFDGKVKPDLYAEIKQTVGSKFTEEQIEVNFPDGITGPFNFDAFSNAAKEYFLRLVGQRGSGIRISGSCSNIRMRNNIYITPYNVEFEVSDPGTGW